MQFVCSKMKQDQQQHTVRPDTKPKSHNNNETDNNNNDNENSQYQSGCRFKHCGHTPWPDVSMTRSCLERKRKKLK